MLHRDYFKIFILLGVFFVYFLEGTSFAQNERTTSSFDVHQFASDLSKIIMEKHRNPSTEPNELNFSSLFELNAVIDHYLIEEWNGTGWDPALRYNYSYNSYNNVTEMLAEMYDQGWINNMLFTYTYDNNQFLIQDYAKFWFLDSWAEISRTTYTNNSIGNPIQVLEESKDFMGTEWYYNSFSTRTYDFADRLSHNIVQAWYEDTWINDYQYYYTYNANGNIQNELDQTWNGANWVNNWQSTYTYSAQNIVTEVLSQIWVDNAWQNDMKETFEYFGKSSGVIINIYDWKGGVTGWENTDRITTTFDEFGNDGVSIWEVYEEGGWVNFMRWTYSWMTTDVIDEEIVPTQYSLSNYPNPFNPETTIEFTIPVSDDINLSIYDIQGNLVSELIKNDTFAPGQYSRIWNGTSSNGKQVSSGVYFYVLRAGNKYFTNKMILLK